MSPTPAPPLPPQIAEQMQSPQAAQAAFMQQGLPQAQAGMEVVQQISQKIQELDRWAQDMQRLIKTAHPPLMPLLQPIAQAGLDLQRAITELSKRSGMEKGSPEVAPMGPQNPAAGLPSPAAT